MNKAKIFYWVFTVLLAAFMLLASVPDILQVPDAQAIFAHLGYPAYLLPFLGVAKVLGVITILVPGFGRLKEWAYAGIVIDLTGALYSHLSVGDPASSWIFPVIGLALSAGSYLFFRKRQSLSLM
jgi:LPXTG-motif cell wall-anchored protein